MKSGLKIIGLEFLYLLICAAAAAAGVRVRLGYIIPFGNVHSAVILNSVRSLNYSIIANDNANVRQYRTFARQIKILSICQMRKQRY